METTKKLSKKEVNETINLQNVPTVETEQEIKTDDELFGELEFEENNDFPPFYDFKENPILIGKFVRTQEFTNDKDEVFINRLMQTLQGKQVFIPNTGAINYFFNSERGQKAINEDKFIKISFLGKIKVTKGHLKGKEVNNFEFQVSK